MAALSRADVPASRRRPFFHYIAEAHLAATHTMVELFPEARKFSLGLVLAHQYLDQLDEELHHTILGNVGTMIVFHLGGQAAEALMSEFGPEFGVMDLVNLPSDHICLKMMVQGTASRPFSAVTRPVAPPSPLL